MNLMLFFGLVIGRQVPCLVESQVVGGEAQWELVDSSRLVDGRGEVRFSE